MRARTHRSLATVTIAAVAALAVAAPAPAAPNHHQHGKESSMSEVIPAPVAATPADTEFLLNEDTVIKVAAGSAEAAEVGAYLAGILRPSTGYPLPVTDATRRQGNVISLLLSGADPEVGDAGYELDVTKRSAVLRAETPTGLFTGVQTLRQLLPAKVESPSAQPGPWPVAGGHILDYPRFGHRAAMLDVARHFFTVDQVKRYIDQLAQYKINYLHLHLTDDQGWRIEIDSWPRLATYGGSTEVGGGPGGYYTKQDYRELVNYAASRHITVVPEVDMPGHTNAALASYAELNCDGVAPPLYTGIEVGFSSLCVDLDVTYEFVGDVLRELAELTPGPYLHIGGDEAHATPEPDYVRFFDRVLPMVADLDKTVLGWHQILTANPPVSAVPQYWGTTDSDPRITEAAQRGHQILLSPANKIYLDMKYDENTPLGLSWAGYIEVADAYGWNPGGYMQGVEESSVLGIEAPLWSETLENSEHIEFMAFPRLPAVAELAWSPADTHDWAAFRTRLAAHGPRLTAQHVNFYPSPQIPWPSTR